MPVSGNSLSILPLLDRHGFRNDLCGRDHALATYSVELYLFQELSSIMGVAHRLWKMPIVLGLLDVLRMASPIGYCTPENGLQIRRDRFFLMRCTAYGFRRW
jgi:hypothetical protein